MWHQARRNASGKVYVLLPVNVNSAKGNECKQYCCEFFLQSAHLSHPYYLKWHPGMFCTPNLTYSCQVICYIPLYTPSMFIACITWTQNMPRHDKVKKTWQMGRLEEIITAVLLYWLHSFPLADLKFSSLCFRHVTLPSSVPPLPHSP